MQLINSEYTFSYYKSLLSAKEPDNEFDINQLIEIIKYGYIKNEIETLRSIKDKKDRSKLKQSKLSCVTLSGTFQTRSKKHLLEHSGLMQIDIDDVKEYSVVFNKLISDEYTFVAFKSPSGTGIKLIIKVNPSINTHLEQFLALEKYYLEEYNIEIDSACKDVSRCMLLSYDPNLYCNPFSQVYAELYMPEQKETLKSSGKAKFIITIDSNNDTDIVENLTSEIEKNNIDITNGYENWIRIGFSLASSLSENGRDYFHRLSKFNEGYNSNTCEKQYSNLLKRNNGAISLGTLIHIARSYGIAIDFPKNKQRMSKVAATKNAQIDKTALYNDLKNKRLLLSKETGKPAFTIFTNKTIDALVAQMPKSNAELLHVFGISQKKCDLYAKHLLPIITNYKSNNAVSQKPLVQTSVLPTLNCKDKELFDKLRAFRFQISNEKGLKAFYVFGNSTLNDLVALRPKNKEELLQIKGFGEKKTAQIGATILTIITSV